MCKSMQKTAVSLNIAPSWQNVSRVNKYVLFIGFQEILRMLAEKGANINIVYYSRDSALLFAASRGNISNISNCSTQYTSFCCKILKQINFNFNFNLMV